jgi:proline iminopeptidase
MDQLGLEKSLPNKKTRENTNQLLIDNFEKIHELLGIKQWLLFGGSEAIRLGWPKRKNIPID